MFTEEEEGAERDETKIEKLQAGSS